MAQSSAAAVIDEEELRLREARALARRGTAGLSPAASPTPCWIVWVPAWFLA